MIEDKQEKITRLKRSIQNIKWAIANRPNELVSIEKAKKYVENCEKELHNLESVNHS